MLFVLLVVCFAVSPGTWPGGAWVPGGPRPGFSLLLLFHDPNFAVRKFHQDVSRFTVQKGLRPNSRIMYRFFTSHQPMMNEQDQVTWTNWPASKKKRAILAERRSQKNKDLVFRLQWRPRETNQEADDLTNEEFNKFDPKLRCEIIWEELDWPILDQLLSFREEVQGWREAKRKLQGPAPKMSKKQKALSKTVW